VQPVVEAHGSAAAGKRHHHDGQTSTAIEPPTSAWLEAYVRWCMASIQLYDCIHVVCICICMCFNMHFAAFRPSSLSDKALQRAAQSAIIELKGQDQMWVLNAFTTLTSTCLKGMHVSGSCPRGVPRRSGR
jgi:hypothetical protein